ncbi:MAG: TraR/DksA family transcriptional regulator [Dokdonella sp.]|nr:MAG: TraR/DksA family transcriptional regulator [Dokdonella sp.]
MDEIDRAQEREQLDRSLALDALRRRLQAMRDAGTARCVDCDEEIDPRRRAAVPHARRCAPCQHRWEKYGG